MKESFSTTFMFAMVMIIIVVFVAFMSITLNFARAFRVKNGVIDIIEQHEGIYIKDDVNVYDKISNYISEMGYSCKSTSFSSVVDYVINDENGAIDGYGDVDTFDGKKIYNVQVCVTWNIPILNVNDDWKFTGKTELIGGGVIDLEG